MSYTLAAAESVETLRTIDPGATTPINLTGNELVNVVIGNAAVNAINGGGGADLMRGLAGNDVYTVDNAGDVVDESAPGSNGADLVMSTVTFSLSDTAHARGAIENVTLIGTAAVNAVGNAAANGLTGNIAANTSTVSAAPTTCAASAATTPMWSTMSATWSMKPPPVRAASTRSNPRSRSTSRTRPVPRDSSTT